MHIRALLVAALCVSALCAQSPQDPEVIRAQSDLAHVREMVEAGVAPRAQLETAQDSLTEAEENAYLRRTLYGENLTPEEAARVIDLTQKRLMRRQKAVARMQQLVNEGVAARQNLTELLEQQDRASKENEYAVTREKLVQEMADLAQSEADYHAKLERAPAETYRLAERYDGKGKFSSKDFRKVNAAFERAFSKNMPVSAFGETDVHRALGFDHRGRVDVAVSPDDPEGVWLRRYLAANQIPYFAFRAAIPGKATGPHIHIGPMSTRLETGG